MIEINNIPDKVINLAKERAAKLGVLKNSIMEGDGNVAGYLGQILVSLFLGGKDADTFDFDVIKDDIKYEVKTKRCKFKPYLSYECSINEHNKTQKCDYYVFVRVLNDYKTAWILGKKNPKDFFKEAKFYRKNEIDPKSNCGFRFKSDCYNLEISKLEEL